ncbi:hypothetical protein COCOBI_12-3120 [Coccomyxa sp. Obi]|nr:hypothetical protein COCOBI_12-3120 [Coccomyxa sp. Obi]
MDASTRIHPLFLIFQPQGLEARFVKEASKDRWHVLIAIFCFDLLTYTIRLGGRMVAAGPGALPAAVAAMIPQLLNMVALYTVLSFVNWRSRKSAGKPWAALQEEVLLSLAVAGAICSMLFNLGKESAKDYTFACFFLICTALLLRLRWVIGTGILSLPLLVLYGARLGGAAWPSVLPADADVHLTVAWATGALLSYMIESQKRQMFLAAELAKTAVKEPSSESRLLKDQQYKSANIPLCQRQIVLT